jgi:hypothetical protein
MEPMGTQLGEPKAKKEEMMILTNRSAWKSLTLVLALLVSLASGACRVRQTQEGELPDVDVKTEGGQVPKYDVDAPDVDVKTEKREVEVPVVTVEPPRDGDQDRDDNGPRPPHP